MKHKFEKYCKEPEKIENYDKAAADNFKGWECHHRKGVDISREKLKALGMYYNRPADELIFLKHSEHRFLHKKGKSLSEETRKKISDANKGKQFSEETRKKMSESDKGRTVSEKTRKKISEAKKGNKYNLGKKRSDEAKKKLSEASKGRRWFNNGKINTMAKECPQGFVPGILKRK